MGRNYSRVGVPRKRGTMIDFGDYVHIMQKRFGVPDEPFLYKVIGPLSSNHWVDVPAKLPYKETSHDNMEPVVRCICCGVRETEVHKYRVADVKLMKNGMEFNS